MSHTQEVKEGFPGGTEDGASLPNAGDRNLTPWPGKMPQATEQPSLLQLLLKPMHPEAPASQEEPLQ